LRLNFNGCSGLSGNGLEHIFLGLLKQKLLKSLGLKIKGIGIKAKGLLGLNRKILRDHEVFKLSEL